MLLAKLPPRPAAQTLLGGCALHWARSAPQGPLCMSHASASRTPCVSCVPAKAEQVHGRQARSLRGSGPWTSASLAWGTGQALWAVTAAPGHGGNGACQAWKAHQEKEPGQGVLASARDAEHFLVSTADRVAGRAHCGFS